MSPDATSSHPVLIVKAARFIVVDWIPSVCWNRYPPPTPAVRGLLLADPGLDLGGECCGAPLSSSHAHP
eukprot:5197402-Prymnesium_polylepis.1